MRKLLTWFMALAITVIPIAVTATEAEPTKEIASLIYERSPEMQLPVECIEVSKYSPLGTVCGIE